jgi:hypothetical protein
MLANNFNVTKLGKNNTKMQKNYSFVNVVVNDAKVVVNNIEGLLMQHKAYKGDYKSDYFQRAFIFFF